MSLTIAVYDKDGSPCAPVALTSEQHTILIHRAAKHELSAFLRMAKPDRDVTFRKRQLQLLLEECLKMLVGCTEPLCALLTSIKQVIETAIERETTVEVIASG